MAVSIRINGHPKNSICLDGVVIPLDEVTKEHAKAYRAAAKKAGKVVAKYSQFVFDEETKEEEEEKKEPDTKE